MRQVHIIGGGTVFHVRPHLALSAPAYGKTVEDLFRVLVSSFNGIVHLYTTKMAGNRHRIWTSRSGVDDSPPKNLETNADIAALLDELIEDPKPKIIFLPAALCDFEAFGIDTFEHGEISTREDVGKQFPRLQTAKYAGDEAPLLRLALTPAEKVIQRIRKTRKDIFLVGFKTTTGATPQEQFDAGLTLVKKASCNLVLANDLVTKLNMVITPEQAPYYVSTDRRHTLRQLVGMALERSKGHFTRSTVDADAKFVAWSGEVIPASLREVVNHCIKRGAYKPFMGTTVGHFAFNTGGGTFVTSRRGVNFNELDKVGMVAVVADGDDKVISLGAKPSVGGQSQRIIFANHPGLDCIVHFHCPLRDEARQTPVMQRLNLEPERFERRSQAPYECGSHECGQNTSDGLSSVLVNGEGAPLVKAVMLDKHGPNIVFNKNVDPKKVIDFIERHWDLERSTREVAL